jgi:Flp pilus assembly pilin Flp
MDSIMKTLASLHREESGQGLVEYVLILGLVALGAIAAMGTLATDINSAFNAVASKLTAYVT